MTDSNVPPPGPPFSDVPGQPPPHGAPPPYTVQKPGETWNVLAIVSLVSAFFISLAAIITGHIALSQIKRSGEKGRGLALAGLIIGYAGVFISIVAGIVLIVVFVLGAGRAISDLPTSGPTGLSDPSGRNDLDWEAGQTLAGSDQPEFADALAGDPAWTVSEPDDGNGNRTYDSADNLCTLTFHQGQLPAEVVVTPGDDRATTGSYLQSIDSATAADIEEYALDDFIGFGTDGTGTTDVLTLSGTDDASNNWITAARAFAKTGTGVYLDLTCAPSATLDDYYYSVIDEATITVR